MSPLEARNGVCHRNSTLSRCRCQSLQSLKNTAFYCACNSDLAPGEVDIIFVVNVLTFSSFIRFGIWMCGDLNIRTSRAPVSWLLARMNGHEPPGPSYL